jgi:hypothetical protein
VEDRDAGITLTTLVNAGCRAVFLLMRPNESVDAIEFKTTQAKRIQERSRVSHVFENDDNMYVGCACRSYKLDSS